MNPEHLQTDQDCTMRVNLYNKLIQAYETHLTSFCMTNEHRVYCIEQIEELKATRDLFYKQLKYLESNK